MIIWYSSVWHLSELALSMWNLGKKKAVLLRSFTFPPLQNKLTISCYASSCSPWSVLSFQLAEGSQLGGAKNWNQTNTSCSWPKGRAPSADLLSFQQGFGIICEIAARQEVTLHVIPSSLWGFLLHMTPAEHGVVRARTPPQALGWDQGTQSKRQPLSNHTGTCPQSSSPLNPDAWAQLCAWDWTEGVFPVGMGTADEPALPKCLSSLRVPWCGCDFTAPTNSILSCPPCSPSPAQQLLPRPWAWPALSSPGSPGGSAPALAPWFHCQCPVTLLGPWRAVPMAREQEGASNTTCQPCKTR